ncbi:23S rRNA (guanosine(2251)-2'-O)-methyltransferase RlmB [Cyanobium sp. FGCU-52]|nr:23S rRNA (guanosine(2251)-2'-O)-methyltransferase RlmB [Cyanobium sp. FGCU52]
MSPRPDRRPDSRPDRGSRRPGGPSGSRPGPRAGGRPSGRFGPPRRREGEEGGGWRDREPGAEGRPYERGSGDRGSSERGPSERGSYGRRPFEKSAFGGRSFDRQGDDRRGAGRARFGPPRNGPSRPGSGRFGAGAAEGDRFGSGRFPASRGGEGRRDERPGGRFRSGDRPGPRPFAPRGGGRPSFAAPPAAAPGSGERGGSQPAEGDSFAGAAPTDLIWGRHSAQAVLESGRPVHRIWCTPEMRFSPRFLQLLREAKSSGVLVEEVTWARLGQISGGAVHQGIVLQPAAAETLDLPSLIEGCRGVGEAPLLIAVDGLTDPQNLGAIVRSAEALGAHGMVLPQRRNAGLTGSVAKVAAGALEHLPVARVVNLNRSLEALKEEGYRVVGLAAEGTVSLEEADLSGPLVVVTGSEGDGLSMLTRRSCDQLVRIPLRGSTPSLNASVATALLLYEIARRGWMHGLTGTAPAPRLVRPSLPTPEPLELPEEPAAPEPAWEPAESQVEPEPEAEPEPEPVADIGDDVEAPVAAAVPELPEPSAEPTASVTTEPEPTEAVTPANSAADVASAEQAVDLSPWAAAVAGADAFESDIRL